MIYWTGVGSRKVEELPKIYDRLEDIGYDLTKRGWVLRSGGADGSDEAFEFGWNRAWLEADPATRSSKKCEIFLPWKGFNGHTSSLYTSAPHPEAVKLASVIHPKWKSLSPPVQKLHARNIHQVLGQNLDDPSKVVVCWTENGELEGGTRTAIVCAQMFNIPVVNLGGLPYSADDDIVNTIIEMVENGNES
jgi:hypothetical protein